MKNEKGFTMVELLGTIIILALLVTLAVVSVSGVLNSSYDTTYDTFETSMEEAATSYLLEHTEELPNEGGEVELSAAILVEKGYLDYMEDPKNETANCQDESFVIVTRGEDTGYNFDLDYKACLICGNYKSEGC